MYISGVIAATALEYVTGYVMERLFKVRYWDYSGQKFQVHGSSTLSSSIAWGFLTILMTGVIHEPVAGVVLNFNQNILLFCVFIVTILFTADAYEIRQRALALGKSLEAMTKLKEEMEDLQSRISRSGREGSGGTRLCRQRGDGRADCQLAPWNCRTVSQCKKRRQRNGWAGRQRRYSGKTGDRQRRYGGTAGDRQRRYLRGLATAKGRNLLERIGAVRESTREAGYAHGSA